MYALQESIWKPVTSAFKRLKLSPNLVQTRALSSQVPPPSTSQNRRPSSLDTVAAQYDREAGRDFRELTRNATAQLVQNVQRQKSASGSKARLTLAEKTRRDGVERHLYRRWSSGEAYSPHDLSSTEAVKARRRKVQDQDAWDVLGIEEHDVYKNFSILSEYTTPMGRIKKRSETGLRRVNQRKLARAVRRAIGIGLIPRVYHHPELLEMREMVRAARGA